MPRTSREISGTGIYHVMLCGINKQDIFDDEDDFLHFIQILHSLVDRHDEQGACLPPYCTIYAYCLMSNHVHLLIREKEGAISETVKRVGVAYARYFNKKYERTGHLFQDRFASEPVNSIEYFMTLMRYIHQNPVKAHIVKTVEDYAWSSWAEFEGTARRERICDVAAVMNRLGRENLREFVNTPVENPGVLDIDSKSAGKLTDEEVEEKLVELSGGSSPHDIKKMKRPERDRMLKQICELGANPRQVSRITGISYGVIFKAKK